MIRCQKLQFEEKVKQKHLHHPLVTGFQKGYDQVPHCYDCHVHFFV